MIFYEIPYFFRFQYIICGILVLFTLHFDSIRQTIQKTCGDVLEMPFPSKLAFLQRKTDQQDLIPSRDLSKKGIVSSRIVVKISNFLFQSY